MDKLESKMTAAIERVAGKGKFSSRTTSLTSSRHHSTELYNDIISTNSIEDPFKDYYSVSDVISPPVNPSALIKLVKENSHLQQCIDAMTTNIHGFGYRMEFIGKKDDETSEKAQAELADLEAIFDSPNPNESFHSLRQKIGKDKEYTGNSYMEVVRNAANEIVSLYHVPSDTMRITGVDKVPTDYTFRLFRKGKLQAFKAKKFFRRYVQQSAAGQKTYFREFGDPRAISKKDGRVLANGSTEELATEIIHFANYNPKSPYGLPNWYSQLPSILGSREAELTNLDFFENNGIPAMAILISGGQLTQESFEEIESNFDTVKGRGSTNRIIILEARGALEDSSTTGALPVPTIQLKPLYAERQNDALFKEYEQACADKIRSAFRLPPVFIGVAADYTYASAKVSLEVAENQIFIPERILFDDVLNKTIIAEMKPKYWRFRSNPASLATSEDLINSINAFNEAGAISPNTAIAILNEKLNLDIPKVEDFWGDLPFKMVNSVLQSASSPDKLNFVNEVLIMLQSLNLTKGAYPVPVVKPAAPATATKTKKVAQ